MGTRHYEKTKNKTIIGLYRDGNLALKVYLCCSENEINVPIALGAFRDKNILVPSRQSAVFIGRCSDRTLSQTALWKNPAAWLS